MRPKEKIKKDLELKLEHNKDLFETKEKDYNKYNKELMKRKTISSLNLEGIYNIDEAINILTDFKNEISNLGFVINYNFELNGEPDCDDENIDGAWYDYKYYAPFDEVPEYILKNKIKNHIANLLKPIKYSGYARTPDCSLLQLFKDGAITWGKLQELTYKNCEM
jgi:hypothetical protein